ncbi:hypothetical protein E3J95_02560 [Candidatus Aerophobetes bacterium]|uniref:Uncharacterized protein n=1 Tax=Aerophobetes bacterium TaxID=2030807 RepID=A0A523QKF8_UNCAE|nr:MAG: hypothetical protein E3J95_02560 [Candidatus Aerophobetes bacterium]
MTAGLRFNKFFGRFHSNVEYGGGASFSLRRRVLLVEDPFGDREIASSNNFGVWGKVVLYTVHGSALELKMDWDQEQWGYGIDMKIQPGIFYSNAIITQRFGRGLTTKIDGGIFLFQDPTVFTVNELRLGIRIFRDKSLLIYWTPMLRWQAEEREQKRWTVNWKGYGGGVEYKLPFRRVPLTIRGFIWNMERKDIWNEWTGGPWREIRSGLGITYEL